jgi:hypothetical protein
MSGYVTYNELMRNGGPPCGSLIEIDRGLYKHWAYYDKNGFCYHITDHDNRDIGGAGSVSQSMLPTLGFEKVKAVIRYARLEDIMKNSGSQTPSKAQINNQEDMAKRNKLEAIDPKITLDFLEKASQKELPLEYNLTYCNCEHYVTAWKYGEGFSEQVDGAYEYLKGAALVLGVGAIAGIAYFVIDKCKKSKKPSRNTSE